MSAKTKAQLQAENEALLAKIEELQAANETLRTRLKDQITVKAENEELRSKIEELWAANGALHARLEAGIRVYRELRDSKAAPAKAPNDRSAWKAECDRRKAIMEAAKREAAATGKTVKCTF